MWLLGEVAGVNALAQFALMALVVLTVLAVLGTPVTRELAFPLAFLFFAVPVGDFIMPQLMEWTADFTVGALRLTGIPVYREGQQFVIPSGHWSVVEACSGLRYLVASLMVGTLFAYLSYRSNVRRLIFVGVSILVPIVANWLRAYMIVMLGHLSGNKLAVGVDHFIYGWVFFGVVIAIMLAIGARWREDDTPAPQSRVAANGPAPQQRTGPIWLAAAAVGLVAFAWNMGYEAIERSDASKPPMIATLGPAGEWAPVPTATPWRPLFQNPPDELSRVYRNDRGQLVGLFIAYYRNQDRRHKLVSSENVLVKSDDPAWLQVAGGAQEVPINGALTVVRTDELRGSGGRRMVVWRWYWINGRLTSDDYRAKAYTALARLAGRGDDSAVVVVYTHEDQPGSARRALESFVGAAAPAIEDALRRTRDTR
jgi:exosortase A